LVGFIRRCRSSWFNYLWHKADQPGHVAFLAAQGDLAFRAARQDLGEDVWPLAGSLGGQIDGAKTELGMFGDHHPGQPPKGRPRER
jgi:hypothetical protein